MPFAQEVESIASHVETLSRMRGGQLVAVTVGLTAGMDAARFREALLARLEAFSLVGEALSIVEGVRAVQVLALEYVR